MATKTKTLESAIADFFKFDAASQLNEFGEPMTHAELLKIWPTRDWWIQTENLANFLCTLELPDCKILPVTRFLTTMILRGLDRAVAQEIQLQAKSILAAEDWYRMRESAAELNDMWRRSGADEEQLSKTRGCSRELAAKIMHIQPWETHLFSEIEKQLENVPWPQDKHRAEQATQNRASFEATKLDWLAHPPYSRDANDNPREKIRRRLESMST